MIRILHIVSSLSRSSGVMSFIMSYYRHINREKLQFEFLYWRSVKNNYEEEILALGGKTHQIPKPSIKRSFFVETDKFFKAHANRYKFLHLHEVYLNAFLWLAKKRYKTGPIIAHVHSTHYSNRPLNAIRNKILCFNIKRNCNLFLACSKDAGRFYFGDKFSDSGKVIIVRNAIDVEKFLFHDQRRFIIRNELTVRDKLVIGHLGRLSIEKNHTFLIDIFYEINKYRQDSVLLLVGEGPLKQQIQQRVKNKGLSDSVYFLGHRSDVHDILAGMDVFVLPSLSEGLPFALIEAQVSGLDCFCSDVIPKEAKISDRLRFLSLNESCSVWASEVLCSLGETKKDRNNYESLYDTYDIKKEVAKLQKLYEDMI